MKRLKKINFIILPFAVWLVIILYMLLNNLIGNFTQNYDPPHLINVTVIVFNFAFQIAVIIVLTFVAVSKFEFNLKQFVLSIPVMFFLFALYSPPSLYMFVYTDEWYFIFRKHPAMPSWEASIFITLQYGIVMLITTAVLKRKANKE